MLKSLWSGLSGLNAHQTALDVESNNIANVNTTGFKYSRATFQDLLSQTARVSTAPNGSIGGTNSVQVGLGVKVASVEKVFQQGSIEQTDSLTDLAIQGNGFFIVSGDDGETFQYTRAGNFHLDSTGNLIDTNGMMVQGWDSTDGIINTNSRVTNISIDPNTTLEAHGTETLEIQANLNSSSIIEQKSVAGTTFSSDSPISQLFNAKGESFDLVDGDLVTFYLNPNDTHTNPSLRGKNLQYDFTYGSTQLSIKEEVSPGVWSEVSGSSPVILSDKFDSFLDIQNVINDHAKDYLGEEHSIVSFNADGSLVDTDNWIQGMNSINPTLKDIFSGFPDSEKSNSIKAEETGFILSNNIADVFDESGNKIDIENGQGISIDVEGVYQERIFVYQDALIDELGCDLGLGACQDEKGDLEITKEDTGFHWLKNSTADSANLNTGDTVSITFQADKATDGSGDSVITKVFEYGVDFHTVNDLTCAINSYSIDTLTDRVFFNESGEIEKQGNFIDSITFTDNTTENSLTNSITLDNGVSTNTNAPRSGISTLAGMFSNLTLDNDASTSDTFYENNTYYFTSTQDLVNILQKTINDGSDSNNVISTNDAYVDFENGSLIINNEGTSSFAIDVSGYPDSLTESTGFSTLMSGLNGMSVPGNVNLTRTMYEATHIVSSDVYDAFGSKYQLQLNFSKSSSSNEDGSIVWKWNADIENPASLSGVTYGELHFKQDGSLLEATPSTLTFSPNSGINNVPITFNLDFGDIGGFNGIVSQNGISKTSLIAQDGYDKGELENISISRDGIITGMFSNEKSSAIGQVALATFNNQEGLEAYGDNLFSASGNSGQAIIETPASAGVGSIMNNAIERSNVDLSKSLIQMIVFQRGLQANSKTISTADEVLQTILDLKR